MARIILSMLFSLFIALGSPAWAAKVNINRADAAALQENLRGIGPVKAQAIVDYRRRHGAFKKIDDLTQVPGIGEATLKKIRRDLSLNSGVTKGSGKAAKKPTRVSSTSRHTTSNSRTGAKKGKKDTPKKSSRSTLKPKRFKPIENGKPPHKSKKPGKSSGSNASAR